MLSQVAAGLMERLKHEAKRLGYSLVSWEAGRARATQGSRQNISRVLLLQTQMHEVSGLSKNHPFFSAHDRLCRTMRVRSTYTTSCRLRVGEMHALPKMILPL